MSRSPSNVHPAIPEGAVPAPPLVVDLDETLIHSSVFWESIVLFMRLHFLRSGRLFAWLTRGKATLARAVGDAVTLDPATLPYDRVLLDALRAQRDSGRVLVLASSADRRLADAVAAHVGLFDHVIASDTGGHLTPAGKARMLVDAYGERGFDYVGAKPAHRPAWLASRQAYSMARLPTTLDDGRHTARIAAPRRGWGVALLRAMRPRQWLKNLLVFVPMLAAHEVAAPVLLDSLLAFLAFSLCASSAYLLNDTLDAADDRLHRTKRTRPIAAGALPISVALAASGLLASCALLACALFNVLLLGVAGTYFLATLCYSLRLKRILMVDIVVLAILYSMRILGGGAASAIAPSFWLLAFSFFIFLSLALLKRHSELHHLELQGRTRTAGRGYTTADKAPIGIMGINTAMLSVLIFILYCESPNVRLLYHAPAWLAGIVPLLVFWLGRLWMLSYRGQVNEDPVLYVSRDRVSLAVFALCLCLATAASW